MDITSYYLKDREPLELDITSYYLEDREPRNWILLGTMRTRNPGTGYYYIVTIWRPVKGKQELDITVTTWMTGKGKQ